MSQDYLEIIKKMVETSGYENFKQIKVAILHHKVDRVEAEQIVAELGSWGVRCWTEQKLLPGQVAEIEIYRAYVEADFILVLLSGRSVKLESVYQANIVTALKVAAQKPEEGLKVIPVRLDECRMPFVLNDKYAVDWWEEGSRTRLVTAWNKEWQRRLDEDDWPYKAFEADWS